MRSERPPPAPQSMHAPGAPAANTAGHGSRGPCRCQSRGTQAHRTDTCACRMHSRKRWYTVATLTRSCNHLQECLPCSPLLVSEAAHCWSQERGGNPRPDNSSPLSHIADVHHLLRLNGQACCTVGGGDWPQPRCALLRGAQGVVPDGLPVLCHDGQPVQVYMWGAGIRHEVEAGLGDCCSGSGFCFLPFVKAPHNKDLPNKRNRRHAGMHCSCSNHERLRWALCPAHGCCEILEEERGLWRNEWQQHGGFEMQQLVARTWAVLHSSPRAPGLLQAACHQHNTVMQPSVRGVGLGGGASPHFS